MCSSFPSLLWTEPGTKGHWNGWEVGIRGGKQSSRGIENWVTFPEWPSAWFCHVTWLLSRNKLCHETPEDGKVRKKGDLMEIAPGCWLAFTQGKYVGVSSQTPQFQLPAPFPFVFTVPHPPNQYPWERVLHLKCTPNFCFCCFISLITLTSSILTKPWQSSVLLTEFLVNRVQPPT